MEDGPSHEVTRLLLDVTARGDPRAPSVDRLFSLVYGDLHEIASRLMRSERLDHTLQPTALVHEAYLRLVDQDRVRWENRAHFFGIAARAMRRILVEHARRRVAAKRGGGSTRITLDEAIVPGRDPHLGVLELDEALEKLSQLDERTARVVELRVFAGMTMEEIAHILVVSKRTIDGDWAFARMWLGRELVGGAPS